MSVFRGTYINLLGFHDRARILGAFQHQNISPLCTPWSFSDGHGILLNSGSTWKRRCWTWTTSFQVPYGSTLIDLRVVVHLFWMLKVERRIIHQWTKDGLNLGCCFSWSQGCLGEGGGPDSCSFLSGTTRTWIHMTWERHWKRLVLTNTPQFNMFPEKGSF